MTLKTSAPGKEEEKVLGLVSELTVNVFVTVMMNPRSFLDFDLLKESPRKRKPSFWFVKGISSEKEAS